jgi:dTDP-4-dehydrorhamnose 3,5-epimerase
MKLTPTPIAGMYLVHSAPRSDARGSLERLVCAPTLAPIAPDRQWVQVNLTRTHHCGTVRGLHRQRPPAAEYKLIRCLRGRAFDVTLDLRPGSPTLGRWHSVILEPGASNAVLIPEGCAHGVQALTDSMELLYHHSALYQPEFEDGVCPDDPDLGIPWPLPPRLISERDRGLPRLADFLRSLQ